MQITRMFVSLQPRAAAQLAVDLCLRSAVILRQPAWLVRRSEAKNARFDVGSVAACRQVWKAAATSPWPWCTAWGRGAACLCFRAVHENTTAPCWWQPRAASSARAPADLLLDSSRRRRQRCRGSFSSERISDFVTVAFSFLFNKYCRVKRFAYRS